MSSSFNYVSSLWGLENAVRDPDFPKFSKREFGYLSGAVLYYSDD